MTLDTTTREHQRLREVAREYRQRGYDVIVEPRADQLPGFLAPFRIDMLARSADENVIVEVRTQESIADAPELDVIAQALHDQPSWRFELVVTNPKDRSSLHLKDAASLNQLDITYRLREARQLSEQEHGEAPFCSPGQRPKHCCVPSLTRKPSLLHRIIRVSSRKAYSPTECSIRSSIRPYNRVCKHEIPLCMDTKSSDRSRVRWSRCCTSQSN